MNKISYWLVVLLQITEVSSLWGSRGRANCRLNAQFASKDCIWSSHNLLDIASEYNNIKIHKTICGKWPSTKTFVKYQNCFQIQPKTHTMLFGRKKHPRKTAQIKIVNHFSISKSSFCETRLRVIVGRFLVHGAVKPGQWSQGFWPNIDGLKQPNQNISFGEILVDILVRLNCNSWVGQLDSNWTFSM